MSTFRTPAEIQTDLGRRLRALRLKRNLTQSALALKAGLARNSIVNLERGANPSLATFVAALSALDAAGGLEAIIPDDEGPAPIAIFHRTKPRQRASRPRKKRYGLPP
jgi:putative transcriptional regulator